MKKAITKNDLINEFIGIGLGKGMVLEVHSSLSSLGYIEGGADT